MAAALAAAVDSVDGVRRSPGSGVEVATQYAGGKAIGVALDDGQVALHVVAERLPIPPLVASVRSVAEVILAGFGDRRPVRIFVDDLDVDAFPATLALPAVTP